MLWRNACPCGHCMRLTWHSILPPRRQPCSRAARLCPPCHSHAPTSTPHTDTLAAVVSSSMSARPVACRRCSPHGQHLPRGVPILHGLARLVPSPPTPRARPWACPHPLPLRLTATIPRCCCFSLSTEQSRSLHASPPALLWLGLLLQQDPMMDGDQSTLPRNSRCGQPPGRSPPARPPCSSLGAASLLRPHSAAPAS